MEGKSKRKSSEVESGDKKSKASISSIPSSIIVNFLNESGERAGTQIEIPTNVNSKQLDELLNSLLHNTEPLPYAFYINDIEVNKDSLLATLEELSQEGLSFEDTINISYQPQSVFRVRPVTRCIETMTGHTDAVLHVSFSPDGQHLASGGGDMAVRFWNVTTSMPKFTCTGHRNHVLCTAWSPDGQYFVSADRGGEIRIWNPYTGKPVGSPLNGHKKWITSLSFEPVHLSPRSTRFASSSKDHTIRIWNLFSSLCEATISGHSDSVECVRWGGTGLIYSCSRDRTIKVWAVDGHQQQQPSSSSSITNPSSSSTTRSSPILVRTLTGHAHRINSLALNCDYVLRTGIFEMKKTVPKLLNSTANSPASTSSSSTVAKKSKKSTKKSTSTTTTTTEGEEEEKEQEEEKQQEKQEEQQQQQQLPFEQDEETLSQIQSLALTRYQSLLAHCSGGSEILVSCSDDFTLFLWKPQEDKVPLTRMTGHQQLINSIAFSPDGRFLASGSFDKKVKLWCGKTGRFLMTFTGHVASVYSVSWSPNSQFLVSASKDSTVKLWSPTPPASTPGKSSNASSGKALFTLPGHEDEVYTLDWSPNGDRVASGSKDRTIKIWHH